MLYGKEYLTIVEVNSTLNSKELQRKHELKDDSNGDGLKAQYRSSKRDSNNRRSKYRSKYKRRYKYFMFHKEVHFKWDCPERKMFQEKNQESGDASVVSEWYDSADVLLATINETYKGWVLESGCSFHMSPNQDWLHDLNETEVGSVSLGNNKCCKIMGIVNL